MKCIQAEKGIEDRTPNVEHRPASGASRSMFDVFQLWKVRRSFAPRSAFTLIEVMIAGSILFMCLFAILALFSNSLRSARSLQAKRVDASMLAAELSLTNRLEEGIESGDFGDLYPDYRWEREIYEAGTNGLFEVNFIVYRRDRSGGSEMTIQLYRPGSATSPGPRPRR